MTTRIMPWKESLLLAATLALAGGGCGQGEEPAPAPSGEAQQSSGNPLTAPVDYLGAVGNSQKAAGKTTSLVGLQQAVKMFQAQEGRLPRNLDELVGPDYFPRLPEPPRGMKFDYNPQTGEIKVVPQ